MKLDPDPNMWQHSVAVYLQESVPWIRTYIKQIIFKQVDPNRGAGFGYVVLANGKRAAGAVIIVRDFELLPIDVFEAEEMHPLTERRVYEVLGGTSPLKFLSKGGDKRTAQSIAKQTSPPMDAQRPQDGLTTYAALEKLSSVREIFDAEPSWKEDEMQSGPGWAFSKYSSYIKAGVKPEDAKSRITYEYLDWKSHD